MKASDFTAKRPGHLVRGMEDYWAFVPHRLPPKVEWNERLVAVLSDADRALGELRGVGQRLSNPYLLINPFMRREAVLSSRIEGTQSSLSDLLFFEAAPDQTSKASDVRDLHNYVTALEFGLKRTRELPLSLRLIRELHAHLMDGVAGPDKTPGEFRRSQNWIGSPGCSLNDATFVPPPPHEMLIALGDLEKFLYAERHLPPVIRLAIVHYQFEAIHPFLDGNGRIGRLLMTLLLCLDGLLTQPLLYLSEYFERHKSVYYEHLLRVSQKGEWDAWLIFFLRGVKTQSVDAVRRSNKILTLCDRYHERVHVVGRSALLHKLVDAFFAHPVTTVAQARRVLDVTAKSALNNIIRLVDAGLIREVTGRRRGRIWVADEILTVISDPLPDKDVDL